MTKDDYESDRDTYLRYMEMKARMGDWHGVSDCANDLRELDREWQTQQRLSN